VTNPEGAGASEEILLGLRPASLYNEPSFLTAAVMSETSHRVTRCPPGAAAGACLTDWQFGGSYHGYAITSRVQRLAREDFTSCETAVLEAVLRGGGDIAQPQLCTLVTAQLRTSRAHIAKAAQQLAQQGKIGRKKISGCWHYAKPGFHWPRVANSH
jgi:hypothetical protein